MRASALIACLLLGSLSSEAFAQQCKFDYITFDRIRLDPNYALATTTRWGILVNTGNVPISLADDWEAGLWYAESSQQLGNFFYELLNPFGAGLILQPGEAVGDGHPMLLAQLQPGETFVTNALIAHFQFGVPFPASDFQIDMLAQMEDQIARTRTDVEIADLGGSAFWTPVSAKRVTCQTSPVGYTSYGSGCASPGGTSGLKPLGNNGGSGPPWVAYLSNMPQLGNWAFGLEVTSPFHGAAYVVGLDTSPGSFPLGNCEILLGLTPSLLVFAGQLPHFEEVEPIPIPGSHGLAGLKVYAQAVMLTSPLVTTNAIELTLGDATL